MLGAIFDEAIRRRLAHANPVRSLRSRRKTRRAQIRELEESIRISEREIVRAMLAGAADTEALFLIARTRGGEGARIIAVERASAEHPIRAARAVRARHQDAKVETFRPTSWLGPLLATMALAGLRIGEVRGLSWASVEPEHLQVREGVDRYNVRDTVKTAAALRNVPIGPQLATILANWRSRTEGKGGLVFPSETGTPIGYPNIANR